VKNRKEIEEAVEDLKTLDDLILEEHKSFKSLLKCMFTIDPNIRPACNKCLRHEFFTN
jgi:hypothetical protein